jgi:hypothetical protein
MAGLAARIDEAIAEQEAGANPLASGRSGTPKR